MSAGYAVLLGALVGGAISLAVLVVEMGRWRVSVGLLLVRLLQPMLMLWYAFFRNEWFSGASG